MNIVSTNGKPGAGNKSGGGGGGPVKGSSSANNVTICSIPGGVHSPSPNVIVTSGGKRVVGSNRVNVNAINNNITITTTSTTTTTTPTAISVKERTTVKELPQKDAASFNKGNKEITLKGDLRNIMHAFGDGTSPSEDSVQLMELILRQEMMAFLFICDTAAYYGGSKVLGLRECIYALRNDKPFLTRLFKYLIIKDQQQKSLRANQVGQSKVFVHPRNYLTEIRGVLKELDGSGELEALLDVDNNLDIAKSDKPNQGDISIHRLISPKYINYAKARSISFARKLPQLQVLLHLHSECKYSQSFMEVLAFLVYDLVAQIVDLSYAIKRERTSGGSNPLLKLFDPRGSNPDSCMSGSVFLRKEEECNNVSEMLVLASELEAKRLKKVSTSSREVVITKSVHCLSPSEIKEAYIRMQSSPAPSISFRSRADKIKQVNFQY